MWIKEVLLGVTGLASGVLVASGVFALITSIGLIPRMADKSRTASHVKTYETAAILGGVWGNLLNIYKFPFPFGYPALVLFGIFSGIFVGCLATSLAESINTTAIFSRRVRLHKGMAAITVSIAVGKVIASLLFFYKGWY